jgi:hypothetical protein
MFKKKSLKDQQILVLVRLINASKKTLVFLALLGQLWTIVPWSVFDVQADTIDNQDISIEQPLFEDYPTTGFRMNSDKMTGEIIGLFY